MEQVLNHFKAYPPNSELSVELLTLKLSMLLALIATERDLKMRNLDIRLTVKTDMIFLMYLWKIKTYVQ